MSVRLKSALLALALLAAPGAMAANDPLKDCPVKEVLRYASVHGKLEHAYGDAQVKILDINGLIPVYGPLVGKCQKIPNPGLLGSVKVDIDGVEHTLTPSATINLHNPYEGSSASKFLEAAVVAGYPSEGGNEFFHLIYGGAGSEDLELRSIRTFLTGSAGKDHTFILNLSVDDEGAASRK